MDDQFFTPSNEMDTDNMNKEDMIMTDYENSTPMGEMLPTDTSDLEGIPTNDASTDDMQVEADTMLETSGNEQPSSNDETPISDVPTTDEAPAASDTETPKRNSRRKKAVTEENVPTGEPASDADAAKAASASGEEAPHLREPSAPSKRERDAQAASRRREQRRRLAENAVLDEDGNAILNGDGSYDESIAELYRVQNMRQIVSGKIDQVRQGRNGVDGYVEVAYKGFRVLIPFAQMDVGITQRDDEDERAYKNREYGIISNMLGAKIDFILLRVELEDGLCAGSRAAATRRKRERILNAKDADGNFLVNPGRRVEARVLSVQEKYAYVEVYGMRTTISVRDVRAEYIRDMVEEIQAGSVLIVYITAIERNERGEAISVAISMRNDEQEKRELERVAEGLQIGDNCRGRVSAVNNRSFFIKLQNGLNAFCFVSRGLQGRLIPRVGDTVAVEIMEKRANKRTGMPLMVVRVKRNITYNAR